MLPVKGWETQSILYINLINLAHSWICWIVCAPQNQNKNKTIMLRAEIFESLKFFVDQPAEILIEFCKLANEYLLNDNKNEKKIAIASSKFLNF